MFDIGWSELLVIAVIAVVFVGPKDLPRMLRAFGKTMGRMRRMAGDFQRQFNDALKEAELEDIKKSVENVGKDTQRDIEAVGRSLDNATAKAQLTPAKPSTGTGPRPVNPVMTSETNAAVKPQPATPQIISAREANSPVEAASREPANSEAPPASAAAGGR
jgi:sec-independent protein translocase protein TatB